MRETAGQPKYRRLRDTLTALVRDLPDGAALPTERELCQTFAVSRSTVRQALHQLEVEQKVVRRQGRGTFAARPKVEQPLELTSHTEDMQARGMVPGSKLIDVRRVAAEGEPAAMLGVAVGSELLRIERLRLADGDPMAIEVLFVDGARFDGISAALGEHASFYQLLHATYGVELASAEETIEAVVAGTREAELLGSRPGAPLLLLSRRTLDTAGRPTEFVRSLYRGDRVRFRTNLRRPPGGSDRTPGTLLRDAVPADAPALGSVFIAAWREAYPGIVDAAILAALDPDEVTDWLQSLLDSVGRTMVVAEDPAGRVVGFTRFGEDPDDPRRGQVYALYVHPGAAHRGIGHALLGHAVERLSADRPASVSLWVFERNHRARRLYASLGFTPDGARRIDPRYRADEVRLLRPWDGRPAIRELPSAPAAVGLQAMDGPRRTHG